jgi:hypothetical protein
MATKTPTDDRPRSTKGGDVGFDITDSSRFGSGGNLSPGQGGAQLTDEQQLLAALLRIAKSTPPDGALRFRAEDQADTNVIEVVEFANSARIPEGHVGVLTLVQFLATNADATLEGSTFTLVVNGTPVEGYVGVEIFAAGGAQFVALDDALEIQGPATIGAKFNHTQAAAHHVGFLVKGWMKAK